MRMVLLHSPTGIPKHWGKESHISPTLDWQAESPNITRRSPTQRTNNGQKCTREEKDFQIDYSIHSDYSTCSDNSTHADSVSHASRCKYVDTDKTALSTKITTIRPSCTTSVLNEDIKSTNYYTEGAPLFQQYLHHPRSQFYSKSQN